MPESFAAQEAAFAELFGRRPLTAPELLRKLRDSYWPAEVVLAPEDFLFLSPMFGVLRAEEGGAHFWINNTKVRCVMPKIALLDLTKYDGSRTPGLIIPPPGAWGDLGEQDDNPPA